MALFQDEAIGRPTPLFSPSILLRGRKDRKTVARGG
jgi:hypothetical protein